MKNLKILKQASVMMAIAVVLTGQAAGAIIHEETIKGGSSSSTTVTTSGPLTGAANHLYLAAVMTKPGSPTVKSVTGLGLSWKLVKSQCAGRNQTRVELWQAMGNPTGNSAVTAVLSAAPVNAVILVTRYSGVNSAAPLGNIVSANTRGVGGTCSGGTDSTDTRSASKPCRAAGEMLPAGP